MAKALSSKQNKSSEKPEAFMPDDISVGDAPSTWGIISHDDLPDPADVLKHPQTVSHQTYSKLRINLNYNFSVFSRLPEWRCHRYMQSVVRRAVSSAAQEL